MPAQSPASTVPPGRSEGLPTVVVELAGLSTIRYLEADGMAIVAGIGIAEMRGQKPERAQLIVRVPRSLGAEVVHEWANLLANDKALRRAFVTPVVQPPVEIAEDRIEQAWRLYITGEAPARRLAAGLGVSAPWLCKQFVRRWPREYPIAARVWRSTGKGKDRDAVKARLAVHFGNGKASLLKPNGKIL